MTGGAEGGAARRFRALAWEEHRNRLAIAVVEGGAELVLFYDMDAERWDGTVLRHAWQAGISCMAAQPRACATLAVGCTTGICYWQLEPAAGPQPPPSAANWAVPPAPGPPPLPDSAWMQFWALPGFTGITCLSWSPCGRCRPSRHREPSLGCPGLVPPFASPLHEP